MTHGERLGKRLCVAFLALYALLFAFNSFARSREFEDGDSRDNTIDDLIIGPDAVEVPFYLDRTVAVSNSPFTEVLDGRIFQLSC